MNKSLIVWLKNGQTCKFEQLSNLLFTATTIEFNYFGVSTQEHRSAVFNKADIVGYSVTLEEA